MKTKIKIPPIKIQGIKSKLVPGILDLVNLDKNEIWIEPFMGSGVVGFNVKPENAVFSDLNPHLINFYNSLNRKEINSREIGLFLKSEGLELSRKGADHFYFIRDRFNKYNDPKDFLFLNRSCFNGMIRFNKSKNFNVPFGHKPQRFSKSYITKIVNQIKNVEILIESSNWEFICSDFRNTLNNIQTKSFIYCDPPYIGRHVDYFDSWDEKDEKDLYNLLSETENRFLLSTWDHNDYRKNDYLDIFWNNFNKINHEHFYHIGGKESNRNSMIEALILNFDPENKKSVAKQLQKRKQLELF